MFTSLASFNAFAQSDLAQQRQIYNQAQKLLQQGKVSEYQSLRPRISNYPLTPYLDYNVFKSSLRSKTPAQVEAFSKQYKDFPFSESVRANYLDELAKAGSWQRYLQYQTTEPNSEKYKCQYYYAKYMTGQRGAAYKGAESLWLSGRSISSACDPLFSRWEASGQRTDDLVLERMKLAFGARNSSLVTYLSKEFKTANYKSLGSAAEALYKNPTSVVNFSKRRPITQDSQDFAVLGHKLLSRKNTQQAVSVLEQVAANQKLSKTQKQEMADEAASWLTNTESTYLAQWRDKALSTSSNLERLERRARLAIQNGNMKGLEGWIARMPKEGQDDLRWQYWQARVEMAKGDKSKAEKRLKAMLGERNFYSAAAAVALNQPIEIDSVTVKDNPDLIRNNQAALTRIKEMKALNKRGSARNEWLYLIHNASLEQKEQLALYAQKHHWYNDSVVATIEGDMWDHLSLRFPIAYQATYQRYARKHNVSPITLMALSRQESAFNEVIRSPVGARGLMQIMPATASHTARKFGISYSGVNQLVQPEKNIEIGSQYFASLMDDYNNNRIFSLAG
ncbi:MAG: transglycosylase SLT domain-containing protein, partial [Vibrio sp.]